ncbi:hypothetical protein AAEX18_005070, partial [Escherichia coli]
AEVELATLTWVDWYNNRRLLERLGHTPPAEAEKAYYASIAKWHLNRSQFGIRIDHDLASISDHSLASQSITIWHASDH